MLIGGQFVGYVPPGEFGVKNTGESFSLVQPVFAQDVSSNQFPMSEAGISAYAKSDVSIDIAKAESIFMVIEDKTPNYIIGTIGLAGYGEDW